VRRLRLEPASPAPARVAGRHLSYISRIRVGAAIPSVRAIRLSRAARRAPEYLETGLDTAGRELECVSRRRVATSPRDHSADARHASSMLKEAQAPARARSGAAQMGWGCHRSLPAATGSARYLATAVVARDFTGARKRLHQLLEA